MRIADKNISISVALVTRNRPESLRRTLDSLRQQSVQPYEVVISDDSGDEFRDATHSIAKEFGCRYISGPRRGLYANRNHVALACCGTHIRTMDDDHTFDEDHFSICQDAVTSDPGSIWTTGEIGYVDNEYYASVDFALQLDPSGYSRLPNDINDNWTIADGSTIYPSEVYKKGFRMIEDGYGASYLEFGIFLYARGCKSRCIQRAKVNHFADMSTIIRGTDLSLSSMTHRALAVMAFNLYFRPNFWLLSKYLCALIWNCEDRLKLVRSLPKTYHIVKDRWQMFPPCFK